MSSFWLSLSNIERALFVIMFACVTLLIYAVAVYPLALRFFAKLLGKRWQQGAVSPTVAFLVPAFNEAKIIKHKIANIIGQDFPVERLEILVCSDSSDDGTDDIVNGYGPPVRLVRQAPRGGKQSALNLGAQQASADILIFTDSSSLLTPGSLSRLLRHFADPNVGAASCVIEIDPIKYEALINPELQNSADAKSAVTEGFYLDFDTTCRAQQSLISSAIGCCGACYAIRRELYQPFHPADCDDMASAFNTLTSGKRVVMDNEAVVVMLPAKDRSTEFGRKVRTITGGIDTFWRYRQMLWQRGGWWFWWFFFSHKICRWLMPVSIWIIWACLLVGTLLGNYYFIAAWALVTLAMLVSTLATGPLSNLGWPGLVKKIGFAFRSLNAGMVAWWKSLRGQKQTIWNPTKR